jgi:hypothetical protein
VYALQMRFVNCVVALLRDYGFVDTRDPDEMQL